VYFLQHGVKCEDEVSFFGGVGGDILGTFLVPASPLPSLAFHYYFDTIVELKWLL
jgi:hypothetical protein